VGALATALLQHRDYQASDGVERTWVRELWYVRGITGWTGANTKTAVLDQVPGTKGTPHAAFPAATLQHKAVIRKLSPTQAFVMLLWDSSGRWRLLPRTLTRTDSRSAPVDVPAWEKVGSGTGGAPDIYVRRPFPFDVQRAMIRRREIRFTTGGESEVSDLTTQLSVNNGKLYEVGGLPFILESFSVTGSGSGHIEVAYEFLSKGPLRGFLAGSVAGVDITVPPLGYLEEWAESTPEGGAPTIGVALAEDSYLEGDPLPLL
jgi:hypothetical protein